MRLEEKKNIALVLSGGGVKAAAFHMGVCLALKEKGFSFLGGSMGSTREEGHPSKTIKIYVGSSAGAIVSTLLASGYSINSLIDAFEMGSKIKGSTASRQVDFRLKPIRYWDIFSINGGNLLKLPLFMRGQSIFTGGIEALLKSGFKINGLFTTRGIEKYLRSHVLPTNDFRELRAKLFIVATQLNHSRKVIFGPFDQTSKQSDIKWANFSTISDAVAASASLPPVFAPYPIKNQKGKVLHFFDGEIRDTLSTHVAADNGADLVIGSYSVQPYHYNQKMGSLSDYGIPLILNQALYQVIEQKVQKHIQHQIDIRTLINTVDGYFKQANLPEEHRQKILEIICRKMNFKPSTDYMYIHPNPTDYEMFFADHFSLNPEILWRIVKIGFRSALKILRQHNI